jgi:hypothetical protein
VNRRCILQKRGDEFPPGHEEFSHFRGWAGGKFPAEEFDVNVVNKILGADAMAGETSALGTRRYHTVEGNRCHDSLRPVRPS